MNREELFKRTRDLLRPEWTASASVLIMGCGSGGARVAEEVARFGVGRIVLADRPGEMLEEHNIIRHPLGYRDLGRPKTIAMRDRLLDINPTCVVETVDIDASRDDARLAELVGAVDQVYLCTDNEPSKHAVNAACVRAGRTMIFAGVFDGGVGGEVGRVRPGGACYACMAAFLRRQNSAPQAAEAPIDYANPNQTQHRSTAALNIDIAQIALIQARVGLLSLLAAAGQAAGDFDGNYVLFGNRAVAGLFDHMLVSEIWSIPRNEECLVCGAAGGQLDEDADELADVLLAQAAVKQ